LFSSGHPACRKAYSKPAAMNQNLFTSNLAEINVSYSTKVKASDRRKITSAKDAEVILREVWTKETIELREEFYIILLNRANMVIGWCRIATGGLTGTVCDPRLIFSIALKCLACSVILAHNHPSGNTQPSASDIQLTKNISEGGKFLEITVLDHIILTAESFYSFADEGLI
jgi:DNA repair protein RadC